MPVASSSRTRKPTVRSNTDKLAAQLAKTTINDGVKSVDEQKVDAMRIINNASQTLSALLQSKSKSNPAATAATAEKHLIVLRQLSPHDLNVERAAMSVLSKLVALDMYDCALIALKSIHLRLCSFVGGQPANLLSIPFPPALHEPVLLNLISTYLLNSIVVLSHTHHATFSQHLSTPHTLTQWIPFLVSSGLPLKHLDSILTKAYSLLIKLSGSNISSHAVFEMRIYALRCLACTAPGTVSKPDSLWDQSCKVATAFIHASDAHSLAHTVQTVSSTFMDLVTICESRSDYESFISGKGFSSFCETWIGFASKANDIQALDKLGNLTRSLPSSSSPPPALATNKLGSTNFVRLGTQLCVAFAQLLAALDQTAIKQDAVVIQRIQEVIGALDTRSSSPPAAQLLTLSPQSDKEKDLMRIAGKTERALGRVRKATLDALEKQVASVPVEKELLKLSNIILTVLGSAIQLTWNPDHVTQMLDTVFVLSRITLSVQDPRTYTAAYDILARGTSVLSLSASSSKAETSHPDFTRCTSGAFYNIGGTLYQAGRYSSAIPFLKEGCRLGEAAVVDYGICAIRDKVESDENAKSDPWVQLKEQLWRRFQLLAVCYMKIGDRRPAFDSFVRSVHLFPYSTLNDHVNKVAFQQLSDVHPAAKELRGVVEKLTQMGACELLLSANDVVLNSTELMSPILGALLEWQVQSLQNDLAKEGVQEVVRGIIKKTLDIYTNGQMPVRTLRVLARVLELMYHAPSEHIVESKYGSWSVETIEAEARNLAVCQDLGQDVQLSRFRGEYQASIHLWLVLLAQRHSNLNPIVKANEHAESACAVLRSMLTPFSSDAFGVPPNRKDSSVVKESAVGRKPSKTTKSKTAVKMKGKRGSPVKSKSSKTPLTPKRKGPNSLNTSPPRPVPAQSSPLAWDSIEALMELLELASHVLGTLSLTVSKIRVLDISRKVGERSLEEHTDRFVVSSSALALEYLKLGKAKRAQKLLQHALKVARRSEVSDDARGRFLLTFSASCAINDDLEQSIKLYLEASTCGKFSEIPNKYSAAAEKIHARVTRIEQTALAHEVFAIIQAALDNVSGSLDGLLRALRLWNRAFESLGRLQPSTPQKSKLVVTEEPNPFDTSSLKNALPTPTSNTPPGPPSSHTDPPSRFLSSGRKKVLSTCLEWRVSQGLLNALFSLFRAYLERGSPREAQYFAAQAKELAESLNAPAGMYRALLKDSEVKLLQGLLTEESAQFDEIERLVQEDGNAHIDLAELYRVKGDMELRDTLPVSAQKHYEEAIAIIEKVDKDFNLLDGIEFGPRLSLESSPPSDTLVPEMLAQILCRYVWLLRGDQDEAYARVFQRLELLPLTSVIQSQKQGLLARLALHGVYQQSRIDMFLSSIGETTIALSSPSSNMAASLSSASVDIAKNLEYAEKLFWSYLSAVGQKGYVPTIRESAVSIAIIKAFQASLGRSDPETSLIAAGLLDASSSLTLQNEMLEAIANKFPAASLRDELEWLKISDSGVQLPRCYDLVIANDDSGDDLDDETASLKRYWEAVRERYQSFALNYETLSSSTVSQIPKNWTVVHISVTEDRSTMFISRQRGGGQDQPLIFCVPLKGRREDVSDEHLTFEDALSEMNEIVRLSNETTKNAASIRHDQSARANWWKERGALDTRLRELLENIEFCWLGAFKTILSRNLHMSPEAINNFRIQFDRVFQRGLRLQDRKTKERALGHHKVPSESWTPNRVTLDDALIECFSTLSPDCRDEELEDLVYFILDLYQFHGVPVAIAEVDIDQVVVDLRSVIEEHAAKSKNVGHGRVGAFGYSGQTQDDEHLFLVLDKNVQGLPWENLPLLRGRSVSRIPSMSFLLDRIHFAQSKQKSTSVGTRTDRAVVDPRQTYYILNPSGDLERTEERFKPWLKGMEKVGWQGISGRAPSELQVLNALETKDLVVYFGHGGAEQYVRSHKLRNLPRCAAVMLWGCSSGALRDMGDFDRVGTPLNYMLAGCPTLVANLWDVTDKDIDTFSQSVFDKLNMSTESVNKWNSGSAGRASVSVVQAVAESREACKLKYLTGAAPVVYGIPFYL